MKNEDKKSGPAHIANLINKGISLNGSGKYEEAIRCFDEALSIDPYNVTAMVDKGFSLENLHQYTEAIECFNRALKFDPKNLEAWQNKGYTFLLLMKFKKALDCFEQVLSIDPNMILAVHGVLNASLATRNYDRAAIACTKLMESSEQIELEYAILLMEYYFQEKHYFDIMELFTYIIFGGLFDQIVYSSAEAFYPQEIGKLLQELPALESNTTFLDRLAKMKNAAELKRDINFKWLDPILKDLIFSNKKVKIIDLEKHAINNLRPEKQHFHTNGKIRDQLKNKLQDVEIQKKLSGIKQRFEKAWEIVFKFACSIHKLSTEDAQSLMLEGIAYGQAENYTKAIDSFKDALQLNPFHYDSFGNLGIALKQYGFPNLAILCYQESLKIFYLNEKCHENLGLAFMEVNRIDDAIANFEESLRLKISLDSPNLDFSLRKKQEIIQRKLNFNGGQINYSDLLNQGNDYIQKGDWNQAEKCFEIAISINRAESEPYLKLGLIYQHMGRNNTAAKTLEKFLKLVLLEQKDPVDKDLASAYHGLGLSYGHMSLSSNDDKYIEKAIEMFGHSIQHDPKLPANYHLIGGLYLRKKKYEKAISNFLKAIELSPNLDEAYGELGQAYLEIGQIEKAVQAFEEALKINPSNSILLNNLNVAKSYQEDSII